jgi:hypothetical protein
MASWWAGKVRQFRSHLRASVSPGERAELAAWTTPAQLALFDSMHIADRRHGLDVVASLRADGATDPDLLLAGLLHDAGKGDTGILPRVAYSLGQHYGTWIWSISRLVPGFGPAVERLRTHPETSAALALGAGCSDRAADLIRYQDDPRDPVAGERLRVADEAN